MDRDVRMRLTFDGSDAERGLGRVADAAQRAGQAVSQIGQGRGDPLRRNDLLDDIFLGGGAEPPVVSEGERRMRKIQADARRRIEQAERNQLIRSQMEELDPSLARYRNPLAGTAFTRLAQPLFIAHTVSSIAAGGARGLAGVAEAGTGMSEAEGVGNVLTRMAEGIPIIGGFVRSLGELNTALSNVSQSARAAAEFAAVGGRMASSAGHALAVRTAGAAQITGLRQRLGEAGISSGGAERNLLAFNLQPGTYLNPIAVTGVTTGREGDLELAAMQARGQVIGSEDVVRARQAVVDAALEEQARRQETVSGTRGDIAKALGGADELRATREGRGLFETYGRLLAPGGQRQSASALQQRENELRGRAAVLGGTLNEQEGAVGRQAKIVQQELTKLEEAQAKAAKDRAEAKTRELDIDRNRLQLLDQQIARGRGQEVTAGLAGPGQLEMLAQMARQAKDQGLLSLPPEFRQQVLGFVGEPAQEKLRQEVRANPDIQGLLGQIRGAFGEGAVQDLEGQRKALEEAVQRGVLESQASLQQAMEAAMRGIFDPFVDALKKAMEAEISRAAAKLAGENAVGLIQGRPR